MIDGVEDDRAKMTGWYDPSQLIDTAGKTIISTLVGEYADPRIGMADPTPGRFFDYSKDLTVTKYDYKAIEDSQREEIWFDYAADVGDGWNSTYAVAYILGQPSIKLKVPGVGDGSYKELSRGELLILGGDGVYPTASADEYERRLVMPYRMAFRAGNAIVLPSAAEAASTASPQPHIHAPSLRADLKNEPHIFALPGNHDWYDSLASFKKLFCSHIFNERKFAADKKTGAGGWRTRQKRSYYAIKLPQNWWLLGVDLQLTHNIDVSQLQYFESIIERMEKGDKVILCVPEPYWVKAIKYQDITDKFEEKEESVEKLERLFEQNQIEVKLYLAGDLHHYRRFEDADRVQKITAGGGGAFLHPTHDFDFRKRGRSNKTKGFSLITDYPEFKDSRKLDWKNLWFFWNNKNFGIVTAIIYPIIAWLIHGKLSSNNAVLKQTASVTINRIIDTPLAVLIICLMLIALIAFTDSNSKSYKWIAGFLHGVTHLTAIFILGWLSYFASDFVINIIERNRDLGYTSKNIIWFLCVLIIPAIGGYFIGAIIMGLYLFVSLHIFGRHDNEAFSALKIEDFKNFVRLHIGKDGKLTIYPLKIERVPRSWVEKTDTDGNIQYYTPPAEDDSLTPELIEKAPIVILGIKNGAEN